jgi:hypothetical protein
MVLYIIAFSTTEIPNMILSLASCLIQFMVSLGLPKFLDIAGPNYRKATQIINTSPKTKTIECPETTNLWFSKMSPMPNLRHRSSSGVAPAAAKTIHAERIMHMARPVPAINCVVM